MISNEFMNKLEKVKKLIKQHNIQVVKDSIYDPSIGSSSSYYLKDDKGFLVNKNGKVKYSETSRFSAIDLSGNGFCFDDRFAEERLDKIIEFYQLINVTKTDLIKNAFKIID